MTWLLRSLLVVGVVFITTSSAVNYDEPLERDEIIEAVNAAQTTWTAGRNFNPSLKKSYAKSLLGTKKTPPGGPALKWGAVDKSTHKLKDVPDTFDSRKHWSNCTGMKLIVDQGACGSCWAVAAASAFSDRLCVSTNGKFNRQLSAENLLSCCTYCGEGCEGGSVGYAWNYFEETGVTTGGPYKSHEGCQPYLLAPCNHSAVDSGLTGEGMKACGTEATTPACKEKCYNKKYKTKWDHDFHEVSNYFFDSDVSVVQSEIYNNGPIETSFDVYEDFFSYKSGVYQYTTGDYLGGHAVKIIGWGTEKGTDYWLVANSWNRSWGMKGFFKFIRGTNDCDFELEMVGGYPITDN